MTAPFPEQTPTPSTAETPDEALRCYCAPMDAMDPDCPIHGSAGAAHPLPLVRHHREGGDEPALFKLDPKPVPPVFATEWAVQRDLGLVINYRQDEEEARARLEKGDALLQRTVLLGPWSVAS